MGDTGIAFGSADIVVLGNRFDAVVIARETGRSGYRKMLQTISLARLLDGMGVPLAATGLIYPVWAMAVSVTTIFFNSLWGRPLLFFQAILGVGKPVAAEMA